MAYWRGICSLAYTYLFYRFPVFFSRIFLEILLKNLFRPGIVLRSHASRTLLSYKKRTGSIIAAAAFAAAARKSPRSFFFFIFPLPVLLPRPILRRHVFSSPKSWCLVHFRKLHFSHVDHHLLFLFRRRSRHSACLFLSHKILLFFRIPGRSKPSKD